MISITNDGRMLGYESLRACSNISHFVTTRTGGCSIGNYASFNCSPYTGDVARNVYVNQQFMLESLKHPVKDLILPKQVHGTDIAFIDKNYFKQSLFQRRQYLEGIDALITDVPGCCICVSTADCVPLLLYDSSHQVVAAVHAGWKGTVKKIAALVLEQMHLHYATEAEDVWACIGPSISLESFEVGVEVYEQFCTAGFPVERVAKWYSVNQKFHIDLWEANKWQLQEFGVRNEHIELSGICTYQHPEIFFRPGV